jgi:hypothetical protein
MNGHLKLWRGKRGRADFCFTENLFLVFPLNRQPAHRNLKTGRRMFSRKWLNDFLSKARQVQCRRSPSWWTRSFTTKNIFFLYLFNGVGYPCQLGLTPWIFGRFYCPACINAFSFKFLDFYEPVTVTFKPIRRDLWFWESQRHNLSTR